MNGVAGASRGRFRSGFLRRDGTAFPNASRTIRRCTPSFLATPRIVPTPNSYSRRISSNSSTLALQSTAASAPGSRPQQSSRSLRWWAKSKDQSGPIQSIEISVFYRSDYHEAKSAGECPTTTAAIMVEGKQAGRKLYVCAERKCQTHAPQSVGLSPQEKAERKKQAEALRVQQEYRRRLLEEVFQRVPDQLARHELDFVALRYFDQLGHDHQHRIFKFF